MLQMQLQHKSCVGWWSDNNIFQNSINLLTLSKTEMFSVLLKNNKLSRLKQKQAVKPKSSHNGCALDDEHLD